MTISRWQAKMLVFVGLVLATGCLAIPKPIESLTLELLPTSSQWVEKRQQDTSNQDEQSTVVRTTAIEASTSSADAGDDETGEAAATTARTTGASRSSTLVAPSSSTGSSSSQKPTRTSRAIANSSTFTSSSTSLRVASSSTISISRTTTSSTSSQSSSLSATTSQASTSGAPFPTISSSTTTVTSTDTPVSTSESSTGISGAQTSQPTTTTPTTSATTSTTSTSAPATSTTTTKPTGACACGYSISRFNDMFVRDRFSIDFRQSSASALSSAGIIVADGFQIGSTAEDGTSCITRSSNVRFTSEGVQLVFPGNQTSGSQTEGAELIFNNQGRGMTRMFIEAEMQVDNTPGTCQALFTFTSNPDASKDEQDMEVIAASLLEASPVKEAGLQLTNHDPSGNGERGHNTVPFPSDPSTSFHKYSMVWDSQSVQYYFDDQLLDGPTDHVSTNPSVVVLNHWGTGEIGFFGVPLPTETVIMTVSSLRVYYETANQSDLPAGCSQSDVCTV